MQNKFGGWWVALLITACGAPPDEFGRSVSAIVTSSVDPHGEVGTFASSPIDSSPTNLFFASLGSNGRTCGSCHAEAAAWTLTPALARQIANSNRNDPLFHPADGTDCPIPQNTDPFQFSRQLLNQGNIRVELPIPANAEFFLNGFADPHQCEVAPSASRLYLFRRPLPSTNLPFLTTVMWDGRETAHATLQEDLEHQANGATLGHAQAAQPLPSSQTLAIFEFEIDLFSAQTRLTNRLGTVDLTSGVEGGPLHLATVVAPAFAAGPPPRSRIAFTIFAAWEPSSPQFSTLSELQKSIGRGEELFNTRTFTVTGVAGLNGPNDANQAPRTVTCSGCHNNPEVGSSLNGRFFDIGTSAAASNSPAGRTLQIGDLPMYTFVRSSPPAAVTLTDPGLGLITGRWADLGKVKVPGLRGLAAREPLFHNGTGDIAAVVAFYNLRFNMGLSRQERNDLVAFLSAL